MFLKKHGVVVTMFVFIAKQNLLLNKKKKYSRISPRILLPTKKKL